MWNVLLKVLKKATKYGIIAFTGYEVGDKLGSNQESIVKETTIIKEKSENSHEIWIIVIAIAFLAIIAASTVQIIKCTTKRNTNNNTAMIQLEAQTPAQPQAARRQV